MCFLELPVSVDAKLGTARVDCDGANDDARTCDSATPKSKFRVHAFSFKLL